MGMNFESILIYIGHFKGCCMNITSIMVLENPITGPYNQHYIKEELFDHFKFWLAVTTKKSTCNLSHAKNDLKTKGFLCLFKKYFINF